MIIGNKIHIGSRRKVIKGTFLNPLQPAVLEDGNTVAWYDYEKTDTLTVDGSNYVSRWNDRLGSGRDLIQATGTKQPLLTVDGVLFDGIDNWLRTAAFTFNQPEQIYLVVNLKIWSSMKYIIDGVAVDSMIIYTRGVSPKMAVYAGVLVENLDGMLINQPVIIRALFNGENSKFQINNSTLYNINTGIINAGGITMAIRGDGIYSPSNSEFKEAIFRKVADNATDEAAIYNYLKKKYAL